MALPSSLIGRTVSHESTPPPQPMLGSDLNGGVQITAEIDIVNLIRGHVSEMQRRGLADATIQKRRLRLVTFDQHYPLRAATPENVETFLDGRSLASKARYQWISDLHRFYVWAIDWGHLTDDPTARVVRPKLRRRLPRPIDTGDLTLALQMADPMMRAWLSLMAYGGFRCVEVSRLEVEDVLWGDRLLRVQGKGDKERMVPMHPDVEKCLRSLVLPTRGRVFRRVRGGGWPAAQVSREVSEYLSGLGINATAHQLRHWAGTHLYRTSKDLRVVQEILGHSSPQTTAIYADWSRVEARRAINALTLDGQPSLLSDWPA